MTEVKSNRFYCLAAEVPFTQNVYSVLVVGASSWHGWVAPWALAGPSPPSVAETACFLGGLVCAFTAFRGECPWTPLSVFIPC